MLDTAKYPVGEVEETVRAGGVTGIVATLVSTSVEPSDLDAVVAEMEKLPGVANATWTATTKN